MCACMCVFFHFIANKSALSVLARRCGINSLSVCDVMNNIIDSSLGNPRDLLCEEMSGKVCLLIVCGKGIYRTSLNVGILCNMGFNDDEISNQIDVVYAVQRSECQMAFYEYLKYRPHCLGTVDTCLLWKKAIGDNLFIVDGDENVSLIDEQQGSFVVLNKGASLDRCRVLVEKFFKMWGSHVVAGSKVPDGRNGVGIYIGCSVQDAMRWGNGGGYTVRCASPFSESLPEEMCVDLKHMLLYHMKVITEEGGFKERGIKPYWCDNTYYEDVCRSTYKLFHVTKDEFFPFQHVAIWVSIATKVHNDSKNGDIPGLNGTYSFTCVLGEWFLHGLSEELQKKCKKFGIFGRVRVLLVCNTREVSVNKATQLSKPLDAYPMARDFAADIHENPFENNILSCGKSSCRSYFEQFRMNYFVYGTYIKAYF